MDSAYQGRLLWIDLSQRRAESRPLPHGLVDKYVGGKGFGAKLLFDLVGPGTEPLGPDNVLMFLPGPLTGTLAPSMREVIVFKSPLTGTFGDSYHGGMLGPEIKYAGYDGIIVQGRADRPVYIYVDDERVEIRDARFLWGQDTTRTYESLYEVLGDSTFQIACIGPAGENLVRFALIDCSPHRQAGRGGGGAVMGSKNLKAIVVRGTRLVHVAQHQRFIEAVRTAYDQIFGSPELRNYGAGGTASDLAPHYYLKLGIAYNARQVTFPGVDRIDGVMHRKHLWLSEMACFGCPLGCGKKGVFRRGPHKGTMIESADYESLALMGANLGIDDLDGVSYAIHLCDTLGLDTLSTGGVIGFAMEAVERGHLGPDDLDEIDLRFGNAKAAQRLVEMIAHREGIGDKLAEGVKRFSETVGQDSWKYALHTKGMEMPGYEPRGLPGHGLGYMTGDKGGEHVQGYLAGYEWSQKWRGKRFTRFGLENKAECLIWVQNYQAGTNALVKCDFTKASTDEQGGIKPAGFAEMLSAATGREYDGADIVQLGDRIWNLTRLFNLREGFTRADDRLPYRCTEEPLPDPGLEGRRVSREDQDYLLDDYYNLRGWNRQGVPTAATLCELGLVEEGKKLGIE